MGDLSVKYLLCKKKIMFKIQFKKSSHRVLCKTNGAPVPAPDSCATVFMAKRFTDNQ